MACIVQNFILYSGDDITLNTSVKNASGGALDLTGLLAAQWVMQKHPETLLSGVAITKTLGAGVTVVNATLGTMRIVIDGVDSEDLESGEYYHELRIQDTNDDVYTVLTGLVNLRPAQEF
jgi:hypothetical protein